MYCAQFAPKDPFQLSYHWKSFSFLSDDLPIQPLSPGIRLGHLQLQKYENTMNIL